MPSRDFSTPLGALAHYIPYLSYRMLGQFAGSIELASFLLMILALAASSKVLYRRASPAVSVMVLAAVSGIVLVPVNIGEWGDNVSVAMYYNRWGWAALALLFLFSLGSKEGGPSSRAVDAVIVASILVFLFFLKASYFAIAVVYVAVFGAVLGAFVAPALIGLSAVLGVALVVEVASGAVSANAGDIYGAIQSSSSVRRSADSQILDTAPNFLLVLIAYLYAAKGIRLSRTQVLFAIYVAGSGALLLNQNHQYANIFTLVVLFAQLSCLVRQERRAKPVGHSGLDLPSLLPPLLMFVFLAPQFGQWGLATINFVTATRCQECQAHLPRLDDFYVGERFIMAFDHDGGIAGPADLVGGDAPEPKQVLSQLAYVETLRSGIALLQDNLTDRSPVMTFDFTSPFNFLLNLPSPSGGYLWVDPGRNVSLESRIPARDLFEDVAYIMIPKFPANPISRDFLLAVYGDEVERSYVLLAENRHWRLLKKTREATARRFSRSASGSRSGARPRRPGAFAGSWP